MLSPPNPSLVPGCSYGSSRECECSVWWMVWPRAAEAGEAHLLTEEVVEHSDRSAAAVEGEELVSTVAGNCSIRPVEAEAERRTRPDCIPAGSHRSHSLGAGEAEVEHVAKEQHHYLQAEHNCCIPRLPGLVATVPLVRIRRDPDGHEPKEPMSSGVPACPMDSSVQPHTRPDHTLLVHFRDSLRVHHWRVHRTILA